MTRPEDLLGKESKQRNSNNGNETDKQSYVIRYSSTDFLAEAVLIANEPKFLVSKKSCVSLNIRNSISADGIILKPP
jgi:hypothetical protein